MWKKQAENKFDKGIVFMDKESDGFISLLKKINKENGLIVSEPFSHENILPEGGMWLLKLKNGEDVLVEKCSYEIENELINYVWIDFDTKLKELIAEINNQDKTTKKIIILSSDKIENYYP